MAEQIGAWTTGDLQRFMQNQVKVSAPALPRSLELSQVTAADKLVVKDLLELSPQALSYLKKSIPVPKITSSAISGGPPSSPADGDIWIALGAGNNGENWTLRYNAGSPSAYKWEFIGGSSVNSDVDSNDTTTSATYVDIGASVQSLTIARSGDYRITFGFQAYLSAGAGQLNAAITKAGAPQIDITLSPPALNTQVSGTRVHGINVTASDVLKMQYNAGGSGGTAHFLSRFFGIVPLRIS